MRDYNHLHEDYMQYVKLVNIFFFTYLISVYLVTVQNVVKLLENIKCLRVRDGI